MSLKEDFQKVKDGQGLSVASLDTLQVNKNGNYYFYDFTLRMLKIQSDYNGKSQNLLFKKLDLEVLEVLRDQLIELGGTPPALPKPKEENFFKKNKTTKITRDGGLK